MAKRILVVDDSRFARAIVRATLRTIEPDCEVIEAGSGDEAVASCRDAAPDLITMDFNMPGIDGIEAAARILEQHPAIPICLVTANIQDKVRQRAEDLGLRFAPKPPPEDVLRGLIES